MKVRYRGENIHEPFRNSYLHSHAYTLDNFIVSAIEQVPDC